MGLVADIDLVCEDRAIPDVPFECEITVYGDSFTLSADFGDGQVGISQRENILLPGNIQAGFPQITKTRKNSYNFKAMQ